MAVNNEERIKALDAALAHIEKQYGKGSVMKLGDSASNMNIEVIPTGSLSLDIALGLGGIPRGRIIEIFGPESSGKTTVALHVVAEIQKRGGIAGFIDAEHALDPTYAKNIGVDIDNLYISQPDCGEQALEITETMVRSGADTVQNERSRQASGYVGENFDVLLYFVMTVLALYLMYRLIRWLLKRVMARRVRTDIVEKADMCVDYDVEKKNVFQRIKEQLSLEERFRKIYRYAVMNYRYDITLKAQMTTRDIDTAIEQTTDEDFSHVSDVYRRVRYGRGRAGVKEMSELNRAIRKIKR